MKEKEAYLFSRSKVTGPFKRSSALGSLWAAYTRTMQPRLLKFNIYISSVLLRRYQDKASSI